MFLDSLCIESAAETLGDATYQPSIIVCSQALSPAVSQGEREFEPFEIEFVAHLDVVTFVGEGHRQQLKTLRKIHLVCVNSNTF